MKRAAGTLLTALFLWASCLSAGAAPLSEPVDLRANLPGNAAGYVRVPHPWGFFATPKGSVLDAALKSPEYQKQLSRLEAAFQQNLLPQAESLGGPLVTLVFDHLRSPVEIAVLFPEDPPVPMPNVLVSARMDFPSVEELGAFVKQLLTLAPDLRMVKEFGPEGRAVLVAGALPVYMDYRADTRVLSLMGGLTVNEEVFAKTLESIAPAQGHPMHALEDRLDASGQGLFAWVNLERIKPMLLGSAPPEQLESFQKWGLTEARALALGWGVRDGKGRIKILADVPKSGYLQSLPSVSNDFSLQACGAPSAVMALSLPAAELLQGAEAIARQEVAPEAFQMYEAVKAAFYQEAGFSVEEVSQALGPEWVIFLDGAGEFLGTRLRDKDRFYQILEKLRAKFDMPYEEREIEGVVYHHMAVPSYVPEMEEMEGEETETEEESEAGRFLTELSEKADSHLYWVEDGGYLIFGPVPQSLMDRRRCSDRISLQKWLEEDQKQEPASSLLLFSTTLSKTPRRLYYAYLQILNTLADLCQGDVDLFALPSAMDLHLPAQGTYGLQVDFSESTWAFEWTFENNPLEVLLSPAAGAVTAVGVVAAVAILAMIQKADEEPSESWEEPPEMEPEPLPEQVPEEPSEKRPPQD